MKKLFYIFAFTLLFASCKEGKQNKEEMAENPVSVMEADSLPVTFKESPVMAPIKGVKTVANPEDAKAPAIVSNRLSIFFEDEETDLQAFSKDFKRLYPKEEYKIISFNDLLKTIEISVPEDVRDLILKGLNTQMPDYKFIVTAESLYEQEQITGQICPSAGWHIDAIGLRKAWETTRGSHKVLVAVVDNGFDLQHEMFRGRIYSPYNIFTDDGNIECNSEIGAHGTHVAGLAVGSATHVSDGVAGVAPDCMLMPIQAFDGPHTTTFALATAVLYAIAKDADVINMSAGPSFSGIDGTTVDFQRDFSKRCQKSEENLWKMVLARAKKKNCTVVFSAGNDHVLASLPAQNRTGNAIVVCASDEKNNATSFTNYADCSTISAPGEAILSAVPGNQYACYSGTSMAAPLVAGTVALMKSMKPEITTQQIVNVLQQTGQAQQGDIPNMIQVDKALEAVKQNKIEKTKQQTQPQIESSAQTQTYTVNGVSFKMVRVEGGTFRMCSNDSEARIDETVHSVSLSSYNIGQTEVTQELWQAVMGSNPSYFSKGGKYPVEMVSWNDVQDFIRRLNSLTGKKFRLPTEAEWEFAARGGNKSRGYKCAGSNTLGSVAWYTDNSGDQTHPVAQKSPNELGLYDMSGNVYEWCSDWYDWFGDYSSYSQTNPRGAASGSCRVTRGGSWGFYAWFCRVSSRYAADPDLRNDNIGFRLAH